MCELEVFFTYRQLGIPATLSHWRSFQGLKLLHKENPVELGILKSPNPGKLNYLLHTFP